MINLEYLNQFISRICKNLVTDEMVTKESILIISKNLNSMEVRKEIENAKLKTSMINKNQIYCIRN